MGTRALSLGVNQQGIEADHLSPSNAKVKNGGGSPQHSWHFSVRESMHCWAKACMAVQGQHYEHLL
jgi:hypothetical protein